MQQAGKILMIIGVIVIVAGIILWFSGNKLNWLGRLPGDIRIEKENFRFYMPIATMILLSIVVSFIIWLIKKF
jgi:hypothetical protein